MSATVTILRDDLEAIIGFLEGFDFDDDPNAELVREYLPRLRAALTTEREMKQWTVYALPDDVLLKAARAFLRRVSGNPITEDTAAVCHMRTALMWLQEPINAELAAVKAELKAIHDVIMCIGCVTEAPETDTYTLRAVKQMALRINELEAKLRAA